MSSALRNKPLRNRTPYRGKSDDDQNMVLAKRRKSLRLQHSISFHIPMEDLDGTAGTANHMNFYFDLGHQKFSLTYLDENDTQNPDTLQVLDELRKKNWQAYFVNTLYNFDYTQSELVALKKALQNALRRECQTCLRSMNFNVEVVVLEDFNPTDNDNQALKITAIEADDEKETLLYEGYLMSWCNPEKLDDVLLPVLLCFGKNKYQTVIHTILSEKFDTKIQRMVLTQAEFLHLSTYCLIMLDENDNSPVKMTFETQSSIIHIEIMVESFLKLWKKIHKDETKEVELDEVLLFNEAFEKFMECSMGISFGCTLFQSVNVKGCYSLKINGQMKFFSTKTIHVVLKYLNSLAVLKLRTQSSTEVNGSSCGLSSVLS